MLKRSDDQLHIDGPELVVLLERSLLPVDRNHLRLANFPPAGLYLRYLVRLLQLSVDPRARVISADFELLIGQLSLAGSPVSLDAVERNILRPTPTTDQLARLAFHFTNDQVEEVIAPVGLDSDEIERLMAHVRDVVPTPWAFEMLSVFPAALGNFFRETLQLVDLFIEADTEVRYQSLVYDLGGAAAGRQSPDHGRVLRRLGSRIRPPKGSPYHLEPLSPELLATAHLEGYLRGRAEELGLLVRRASRVGEESFDYLVYDPHSGELSGYRQSVLYALLIEHTDAPPVWDAEWQSLLPEVEEPLGRYGPAELTAIEASSEPL